MKRAVSASILKGLGWKVKVSVPDFPKCVICVAPHTSNWDFFIGKLAYLSIGRYAGFMMKKEWFFPPLGALLKSMGGVPISREKHTDLVAQLVDEFNRRERFSIAITPDATRRANVDWKKDFIISRRGQTSLSYWLISTIGKKRWGSSGCLPPRATSTPICGQSSRTIKTFMRVGPRIS